MDVLLAIGRGNIVNYNKVMYTTIVHLRKVPYTVVHLEKVPYTVVNYKELPRYSIVRYKRFRIRTYVHTIVCYKMFAFRCVCV